jgi:hypothetical protein
MRWYWWGLIIVVIAAGGAVAYKAKGLRNNNPGNIRDNPRNKWLGRIGADATGFVIFDTPENGIRAMAKLIKNHRAAGHNTIAKLIKKWAPASENNTAAYIASVSDRAGIGSNVTLTNEHLPGVIAAMIRHENGLQPYSVAAITSGVRAV